jgi:hypothetical protein
MEGEARAVISGGMLTDEECIQEPNQTEHQEPSQQPHLSQDLLMSVGTSVHVCVSHIIITVPLSPCTPTKSLINQKFYDDAIYVQHLMRGNQRTSQPLPLKQPPKD